MSDYSNYLTGKKNDERLYTDYPATTTVTQEQIAETKRLREAAKAIYNVSKDAYDAAAQAAKDAFAIADNMLLLDIKAKISNPQDLLLAEKVIENAKTAYIDAETKANSAATAEQALAKAKVDYENYAAQKEEGK